MRFIRPKLITFDITGTLLKTDVKKHYGAVGLEHGIIVDPIELSESFNVNFKKVSREHPVFGKHTGLGSDNWWRTVVYAVFRDLDSNIPEEKLSKVTSSLIKRYRTKNCWNPFPGTIELLESLQEHNILIGIISNFDDGLDSILHSLDMKRFFSFVLCSYNLGIEKPNPEIFNEALKIFKQRTKINISPEEALHIGDSVDEDYRGARNANWNAFLIKRDDKPVDPLVKKADIFSSLEELRRHFKKCN